MTILSRNDLKVNQNYSMVQVIGDCVPIEDNGDTTEVSDAFIVKYLGNDGYKWVFQYVKRAEDNDYLLVLSANDIDHHQFFITELAPPAMDKRIIIRISSQDHFEIEMAAHMQGMPMAEFIRRASRNAAREITSVLEKAPRL